MDKKKPAPIQRPSTKLGRPKLTNIYLRHRVFGALSIAHRSACCWVNGPAGSGKTTAVNSYMENENQPCIWYTMDAGDRDMVSFFYYVRMAADAFLPAGTRRPPALTVEYFSNIPVFGKLFFEQLFSALSSPLTMVLDDYHEITAKSPLHAVVREMIASLPPGIKLCIISRQPPPPALVRALANGELNTVGWRQLRLDLEETREMVKQVGGLPLPSTVVADLHAKTDGWLAGLLLVLKQGQYEQIEPQFLGRHTPQEVFDYLNSEIFDRLPGSIRTQMLQLAFFPKVSAAMLAEVSSDVDAETVLMRLHHENAFLDRLVGHTVVYRFHPLMRDFLQLRAQQTMPPEALTVLQLKSAAILAETGFIEESIALSIQAGDHTKAVEQILTHAPNLAVQGRFRTLEALIADLPEAIRKTSPWLVYWQAVCQLPYSVREGVQPDVCEAVTAQFIHALEMFEASGDEIGSWLAFAGILDAIWMGMDDFSRTDPWIVKYDQMRTRWEIPQFPEIRQWILPAIVSALVMRRPDHPTLPGLLDECAQLLKATPDATVGPRVFVPLAYMCLLKGDLPRAEMLIAIYRDRLDTETSPWATLILYSISTLYGLLAGNFRESVRIAERAARLEESAGLRVMFPTVNGAIGALNDDDPSLAEELMRRVTSQLSSVGHYSLSFFHGQAGWIALARNDCVRAKMHAEEGLQAGQRAGCPLTLPLNLLLQAIVSHLTSKPEAANADLDKALELARRYSAKQTEFSCLLVRAEMAVARGDRNQTCSALTAAFQLGRTYDYVSAHYWRQPVVAELCALALMHGIEVDYAKKLVRQRKLSPAKPPLEITAWPWPLRIHTLGRFRIEVDGRPLAFTGKTQHRPLSVLKYILSKGGQDVPATRLQDALWPESDGDLARIAFKTALHRLRKLLGEPQTVLLVNGHLSLNKEICWTDLWAFDAHAEGIRAVLVPLHTATVAIEFSNRLLDLYRGAFLPEEEAAHLFQFRRTMEMRFMELVKPLVIAQAKAGHIDAAKTLLEKAHTASPASASLNLLRAELL